MMQSPVWQKSLGRQMADQARRSGYGDDKRTEKVFTGEEEKALARNKTTSVDSDKIKAAWEEYQTRQEAARGKLKSSRELRTQATKARRVITKARTGARKAREEARKLTAENDALKKQAAQLLRDRLKIQFEAFSDAFTLAGLPKGKALEAFAKQQKMPLDKLKEALK